MTVAEIETIRKAAWIAGWKVGIKESLSMFEELADSFNLIQNNPDEFDRRENIRDYAYAKEQIKDMKPFTFGADINVLLITDRLHGCAQGLHEYFCNSADISSTLVYSLDDVIKYSRHNLFDFFIIVGMFHNDQNYESIQVVKELNKEVRIIMYAHIDNIIRELCDEHKIENSYSRIKPMNGFISYMRQLFKELVS